MPAMNDKTPHAAAHTAMLRDAAQREERQAKKMVKVGMIAAFSGGIGFAVFILQRIFSGIAPDAGINAIIDGACVMLMSYTGAIFLLYLFGRPWLLRGNMVLLYVVMPLWLIQLISGHM